MNLNRLWAPWRIKYLKTKRQKGCMFCNALKSQKRNYIILKTKYSFSMLNIFPYNNGHIMVAPLRHVRELSLLKDYEILDLFQNLNKIKTLLEKTLRPHGYNIGINVSKTAGAGITGHMHIHIVPRWMGDTNFMPVIHDTKIISQSLGELYKELKKTLKKSC